MISATRQKMIPSHGAMKMAKRSPRLQFSKEERDNPKLKKAIKKADKAADKLDRAEKKIPKSKISHEEKKPPSKLVHDVPMNLLTIQFHREMSESDDNSSV